MTKEKICDGCTSFIDGGCARSILPFTQSERVPECFAADPNSMAGKYYDAAKDGYEAIDVAIVAMNGAGFADEQPLFAALTAGISPHVDNISQEGLHHLGGYIAGAASRLREALSTLSQHQPTTEE